MPLEAVKMSPGCMARPLTMFSHVATMKCTSRSDGCSLAKTWAAPRVAAAPPMSVFINSMLLPTPVLRFKPPESKVKPLPTMANLQLGLPWRYIRWMNWGGISEAWATPKNAPIPKAAQASWSKIWAVKWGQEAAISWAVAARVKGVTTLAGAETSSRAKITPSQVLAAISIVSGSLVIKLTVVRVWGLVSLDLNRWSWCKLRYKPSLIAWAVSAASVLKVGKYKPKLFALLWFAHFAAMAAALRQVSRVALLASPKPTSITWRIVPLPPTRPLTLLPDSPLKSCWVINSASVSAKIVWSRVASSPFKRPVTAASSSAADWSSVLVANTAIANASPVHWLTLCEAAIRLMGIIVVKYELNK